MKALKASGSLNLKRELLFTAVVFDSGKNLRINIPKHEAQLSDIKAGDLVLCYLIKLNVDDREGEE